jgi:hypothetical protein
VPSGFPDPVYLPARCIRERAGVLHICKSWRTRGRFGRICRERTAGRRGDKHVNTGHAAENGSLRLDAGPAGRQDHLFSAPQISLVALPPSADLRGTCPPVYDQEQIGSCTANAIGAAFEFETTKQGLPGWGQAGYFTMPYAYLTTRGLSSDFWTIRIVT